MRKFDLTRIIFISISLLILILGFTIPEASLMSAILGALAILVLVIFDIKSAKIAKLSENNPKVRTMRYFNRFTICIITILSIFAMLGPMEDLVTSKTGEIILIGIVSMFIMIFGNISPKIPFNRYFGLRLPWTIRDEDTWKIAHRIVGYLSFPVAIIMFILSFFFKVEVVATIGILAWIIIPGAYSLKFYYKKYKGINI